MKDSKPNSRRLAELLLQRRDEGSTPLNRRDNKRIALAIEGGAMRGVVSAGMVSAIEKLGLLNSFDAVYGSSAGAITAAYLVSEQATYGTTIFYENINNNNFIDIYRILRRKNIVDLDYLTDEVFRISKPLNFQKIKNSPITLNIIASNVDALKSEILRDFIDLDDIMNAFSVTARIPFFAGPAKSYRSARYLDAAIYESIPFKSAVADGFDHIVTLHTRPLGVLRGKPSLMERIITIPHLSRRYSAELGAQYARRADEYKKEIEFIKAAAVSGDVLVLPIALALDCTPPSPFEKKREILVSGAKSGFQSVYRALGLPVPGVLELLSPDPNF